jgi:hypothetical protein
MKAIVFWNEEPCSLVNRHYRFEGDCYLYLQSRRVCHIGIITHDERKERAGVWVFMGPIRPVGLKGTALARTLRGEKASTSSMVRWISSPNRKRKKFRVVCCLLFVVVSIYAVCL